MAEISELGRKQIECWTALKAYLEQVFADEKLENLLFNGRRDIELFTAKDAEVNAKGAKVQVVYGINGVGAYRKVEDETLFQNIFHYRWGHRHSPFALAFALAADSKDALTPADLEAKLGPYRQMAAGTAQPAPQAK
ncbi:MAG TPA: hypothetical protein HA362_00450 [Nanoarchaeota archaeon]|nr:hypothetical protein [Nanoarchaeota archaeon]